VRRLAGWFCAINSTLARRGGCRKVFSCGGAAWTVTTERQQGLSSPAAFPASSALQGLCIELSPSPGVDCNFGHLSNCGAVEGQLQQSLAISHDRLRMAAPFLCLLALSPALFLLPVTHDAIWQMWIARQMLGGAELYKDIIEVNPPLWFWIAVPLASLGADPRLTIIGFFIAAIALSLYLTPARFRLAVLTVSVLVPLHDFGQREHFTLLATIPYVFAVIDRFKGTAPRHPFIIGLFAGVGLCLKPHFLLLPAALEFFLWRTHRRLIRPETIAMATFGFAYAAAIPLFAPSYLSVTLPIVLRFYGDFGALYPNYTLLAVALVCAGAGALLGRRTGSLESRVLTIASLAFVPVVLIQNKGFIYHSIPLRGFLCLAIIEEFLRMRTKPFADGLLFASALVCCSPIIPYANPLQAEMDRHLAGVLPGTSIIVLAGNPTAAWPMVSDHRLDWQLHEFSPWQVYAVVRHPELLPEARRIVAPDLAKRPEILILDRRPILGNVTRELLPPGYLRCYKERLRTLKLDSFRRVC
jgi:hypothetical protein